MGSKRATTNVNRSNRLVGRLKDIYTRAEHFGAIQKELLDKLNEELYESDDWKRAPEWMRQYVRGWGDCLRERIIHEKVEHRYFFEGEWRTHENIQEVLNKSNRGWASVADCPSGFFWKKEFGWGLRIRPFFLSEESESKICMKCLKPITLECHLSCKP